MDAATDWCPPRQAARSSRPKLQNPERHGTNGDERARRLGIVIVEYNLLRTNNRCTPTMLVARNSLAQRKATFLHPHTPLLPRHVVKCTSKGLVDGQPATAAPDAVVSASQGSAAQTQAPERADGFPVTPVTTPLPTSVGANSPYESLDDMAAYVEARRREEDDIRRKREEVELQLLRMRQQEAVRRQQAIKLRLATERANAAGVNARGSYNAHLASSLPSCICSTPFGIHYCWHDVPPVLASAGTASQQPSGDAEGGGSSSPGAAVTDGPSPMGGPPGAPASSGAPKKKLMLKKSKRMTAVAAAAGLHRVGQTHEHVVTMKTGQALTSIHSAYHRSSKGRLLLASRPARSLTTSRAAVLTAQKLLP